MRYREEVELMATVTTPKDVALLDSRKPIAFSARAKMPITVIVGNARSFTCPHFGEGTYIFKAGREIRAATKIGTRFGHIDRSSDRDKQRILYTDCRRCSGLRIGEGLSEHHRQGHEDRGMI